MADNTRLQPGLAQKFKLDPGSTSVLDTDVPAGTLARFVIDQDDPALRVGIIGPDGSEIRDVSLGAPGRSLLSVDAVVAGHYRISFALPADRPGETSIVVSIGNQPLDASHSAKIQQAEQLVIEAQRAITETPVASLRRAILLLKRADAKFADAGDRAGQTLSALKQAELHVLLSEYPQAKEQYGEAERLATDADWRMQALNGRARMFSELWESDHTLEASQAALALSRELHNRRSEAAALASHADGLYLRNDYVPARKELTEAFMMAQGEGDRVTMARARCTLSWLEKDEGRARVAMEVMRESEELFRRVGDVRSEVMDAMDIASQQAQLGELHAAIRAHLGGALLFRKMGHRLNEAFTLLQLGLDYAQANDHTVAIEYYQQAYSLARAIGQQSAEYGALSFLCRSQFNSDRPSSASTSCSKLLQFATAMHQPKREATALQQLAQIESRSGHTDRALALYTQAADLSHRVNDARWEATARLSLGRLLSRTGDRDGAIEQHRQALSLSTSVEDANTAIAAHDEIAGVERARGDLENARKELETALRLAEAQRAKAGSDTLRSSYFASVRESYELYAQVLFDLHKQRPSEGLDRLALEQSEKAHARTLLDSLVERNAELTQARDPQTARRLRDLRSQVEAASNERTRLLAYGGSRKQLDANIERIRLLNAEYDTLRSSTAEAKADSASLTAPSATADQIQQEVLGPDTTLVEYLLGDESGIGWAVTQQTVVPFPLPSRQELEKQIERWRTLMMARKPRLGEAAGAYADRVRRADRELQLVSAKLGCTLLGPVATQLKTRRLVVVPDGSLESLAFGALPLDPCGHASSALLASRFEVTVAPSASSLLALRRDIRTRPAPNSRIAVLADPVFTADDPRVPGKHDAPRPLHPSEALAAAMRDLGWNTGIPRLPGTRIEADNIKARASNVLEATNFDASLATALQPDLARYRILHFATHGLLDTEQPEFSGLVLSLVDPKGRDQNGYLSAQDIYEQRLLSDLVVLSACDSGRGTTIRGEGVVGLARAFLHAGAARVVSTLWKVDDDATSELMRHFYDGMLRDGKPPSAALRYAQLRMMQQKRWSAPFYWAGFVLSGEWR